MGRNIGDDMTDHLEHTIASNWRTFPPNISGSKLAGSGLVEGDLYRGYYHKGEDDKVSIANSTVRDILGDDMSNDGSVSDKAERLRDYRQLGKVVLNRYYGEDELHIAIGRDKSPPVLKRRPPRSIDDF